MKPSAHTWRAQWDVHAWVGAAASLVLFVVCFCGVFSLYRRDLAIWQERRAHVAATPGERVDWDAVVGALEGGPMGGSIGVVRHPPSRLLSISVASAEGEETFLLDPVTGERHRPGSRLADELYDLHFLEQVPFGPELAGLAGLALVVATVTGLVVHLKDLPGAAWRFRPDAKRRFVASDAHKVLGLFGLPFAIVYGWSGAALGWFDVQTTVVARLAFGGDEARVEELRGYAGPVREPIGRPAPALGASALVASAGLAVGRQTDPEYLDLLLIGDERAWASAFWETNGFEPRAIVAVDAVSGAVLQTEESARTLANDLDKVLFDLHYARFGGRAVQASYALLAVGLAAVALTGNLVWLDRRDPRRERLGNRLLERATVGVPAGLVLGCAVALASNRMLPLDLAWRGDAEIAALYASWSAVVALAQVPAVGSRAVVLVAFGLASVLYAGAAVVPEASWFEPVAVIDALLASIAIGCGAVAFHARARCVSAT